MTNLRYTCGICGGASDNTDCRIKALQSMPEGDITDMYKFFILTHDSKVTDYIETKYVNNVLEEYDSQDIHLVCQGTRNCICTSVIFESNGKYFSGQLKTDKPYFFTDDNKAVMVAGHIVEFRGLRSLLYANNVYCLPCFNDYIKKNIEQDYSKMALYKEQKGDKQDLSKIVKLANKPALIRGAGLVSGLYYYKTPIQCRKAIEKRMKELKMEYKERKLEEISDYNKFLKKYEEYVLKSKEMSAIEYVKIEGFSVYPNLVLEVFIPQLVSIFVGSEGKYIGIYDAIYRNEYKRLSDEDKQRLKNNIEILKEEPYTLFDGTFDEVWLFYSFRGKNYIKYGFLYNEKWYFDYRKGD